MIEQFTQRLLTLFVKELDRFIGPLLAAGRNQFALHRFLTSIGWDLDKILGTNTNRLITELKTIQSALAGIAFALQHQDNQQMMTDVHARLKFAIDRLDGLFPIIEGVDAGAVPDTATTQIASDLAQDIASHLCLLYFARHIPIGYQLALLIGLVVERRPPPIFRGTDADADHLRLPVVRPEISWQSLMSPTANPMIAIVQSIDLSKVHSFDSFMAQISEAFSRQLADMQRELGRGGLNGMSVHLDHSGLSFVGGDWLLFPDADADPITLSLSEAQASFVPGLVIDAQLWRFTWQADAPVSSAEHVLFSAGGIEVVLPEAAVAPENIATPGLELPGFDLSEEQGVLTLKIIGGLGIKLPVDVLTGVAGDRLSGQGRARATIPLNGQPRLRVDEFQIGQQGDQFHIGGKNGLAIRNALLKIEQFELPFPAGTDFPLNIVVSGELALPYGQTDEESLISISGRFGGGNFALQSTGVVYFGDGLTLHALGTEPVLSLQVQTGEFVTFAVAGLLKVPKNATSDGLDSIAVAGQLKLAAHAQTGAWSITEFQVDGDVTGDWTFPGGVVVEQMGVSVAYTEDRFVAGVQGQIQLGDAPTRFGLDGQFTFLNNDQANIQIDAGLVGERIDLLSQVYLFGLQTRLSVRTHNETGTLEPSGFIAIKQGTLGLFPIGTIGTSPTPDQFQIVAQDVEAQLDVHAAGFSLALTGGDLLLPPAFNSEAGGRAKAGVTDAQNGIVLTYKNAVGISFTGSVLFENFMFQSVQNDPSSKAYVARLLSARLVLPSIEDGIVVVLPFLSDIAGELELPLTAKRTIGFALTGGQLDLKGLPLGTLSLLSDVEVPLDTDEGFVFIIRGAEDNSPTRLTVDRLANQHTIEIGAEISLKIDATFLTTTAGDSIFLGGGGLIKFVLGEPVPTFEQMSLKVGGEFHIGGPNGLFIHGQGTASDAFIEASGIETILTPTPQTPFVISLSGEVQLPNNGPSGGLDNARFIFDGSKEGSSDGLNYLPKFDLEGVTGGTGDLGDLPFRVTLLHLKFGDGELPEKLHPLNTELTASVEFSFGGGSSAAVDFGVSELHFKLDENGLPQLSADGAYIEVSGLKLGFISFSGGMALGGLLNPAEEFVAAGKLGGKIYGTGIEALVAIGVNGAGIIGPLGAALDVSGGSAGIPLGPTGFLLTGVKGGVSYTGSNSDPDDLKGYVQLTEKNGQLAIEEYNPPSEEETVAVAPSEQLTTAPVEDSDGDAQSGIICPSGKCPPESIGILYEPHPDRVHYPHRVIFKFTSLNKQFVDEVLALAKISATSLATIEPNDIAGTLADGLVLPADPIMSEALQRELKLAVKKTFSAALSAALNDEPDVYTALLNVTYAGVPAVQEKLKLTGTFSYAGVASVLSVTGGFVLDLPNQVVGVLGSLNFIGIPVGKLRAFLAFNNDVGQPDPSLCGDLNVAIGPLDLGLLRMSYRYGLDFQATMTAAGNLLQHVSASVLADVAKIIDHTLFDEHGQNPIDAFKAMSLEQQLATLGFLVQRDDGVASEFLSGLFNLIYDTMSPELLLCGSAQPKIFGLPLGAEPVGVSAQANKQEFAASFRFAPSMLLSRVLFDVIPTFDQMALSFRASMPDPKPIVAGAIQAAFATDPAVMRPMVDHAIAHVLREGVATITYSIAPMGFELADAQARLIMPDLLNHPADPSTSWERPEQRDNGLGLPSRLEVALAALSDDKLGDVYWYGTGKELSALPDLSGYGTALLSMSFQTDYFPHGGIIGAGKLNLPKLFIDAPDLEQLGYLLEGQMNEKWAAAQAFLAAITTPIEIGRMAFYVPLPNPPPAAIVAAQAPLDLVHHMLAHPFDIEAIVGGELYPLQESFFQGSLGTAANPLTLLGIPVGSASAELVPPDDGTTGYFRIHGQVPKGSWLANLVGRASLLFEIRQPPSTPVIDRFQAIKKDFNDGVDVMSVLLADLIDEVPKVALVATIDDLQLPSIFGRALTAKVATVMLYAYSPFYDYKSNFVSGDSVQASIQNFGGMALTISDVTFKVGPFSGNLEEVLIALGPPPLSGGLPLLSAEIDVGAVSIPNIAFKSAHLSISSAPSAVMLSGEVEFIQLGLLRIESLASGQLLRVSVDSQTGTLRIDPARLVVPILGAAASIRIHGATKYDPFTFSSDDKWNATLSIENFALASPLDNSQELLSLPGIVSTTLAGDGLRSAKFTLNVSARAVKSAQLIPDININVTANGVLIIHSDGRFSFESEAALAIPNLRASGTLSIGLGVAKRGRPAKAYARLAGDGIEIANLPPVSATLEFSTSVITASVDFGSNFIGIARVIEVKAQQWKMRYQVVQQTIALEATKALAAYLLGKAVASIQSLKMSVSSSGDVDFSCAANGWVTLLPNLLELQPKSLKFRLKKNDSFLVFDGDLRALHIGAGSWHVTQPLIINIHDGPFETVLLKKSELVFLPTSNSGFIYRRTGSSHYSRLLLSRNEEGVLSLALRNVGVKYNGDRWLSATINSQGLATFEWPMTISGAGVTYVSQDLFQVSISLNLQSPSASLTFPKGKLKANFPGWPVGGHTFPLQAIVMGTNEPAISQSNPMNAKSWQLVPGAPFAQYKITTPKIDVALNGATFSVTLIGGVSVRSTHTQPNGQRWAEVGASIDVVISSQDLVSLGLPAWGNIGDPLESARSTCRASAQVVHDLPAMPDIVKLKRPNHPRPSIPFTDPFWVAYDTSNDLWSAYDSAKISLENALDQCAINNPQPPNLSELPTITVGLNKILLSSS